MNANKLFSVDQIRAADNYTIEHEPVASVTLMERAAIACANWIRNKPFKPVVIHVFCGLGNNGGDGLAIARLLLEEAYAVSVYIVRYSEKCSEDFLASELALKDLAIYEIANIYTEENIPLITEEDVIIDSLFGCGLSRPVEGLAAQVIERINLSKATVISIDLASGLFADQHSDPQSSIVKPTYTLSFQFPKAAFFFAENEAFVGEFITLPIGLHPQFLEKEPAKNYFLTEAFIKTVIRPRKKFSHKGSYGHALFIAGSEGKMGAAVLSAKALLRSGAGLLTMHVPGSGYLIIQSTVPEAMVIADKNARYISECHPSDRYSTVGIGPGIGTEEETGLVLETLLRSSVKPMVLDADALNILSMKKDCLALIPRHSILTPHIKEFERLTRKADNDFERNRIQVEFSQINQVYVILKGAHTCITTPDGHCYFNSSGNPGMAKGGSGDVLTGTITSLLAQSYSPLEAALIGVYVHGLAGDIARLIKGETGMIASDIIDCLPEAFLRLSHR
ncbi:MAG: carbohydrate kinase [Bacteroidetes bacterium]|jgi:NAD(P)H-hydrate epimerase|nr:carbohydrate kinase [Bacteroidota bacterium]MDF2450597.1 carbohydrate kinase [Bacteroidota bacterium]